jgi:hypothetical protein
MSATHYAETIVRAITPYVGQMMARSSLELHCKRLGADPSNLNLKQLDALLQQLSLGLKIFIGREKTDTLMRELRTSLTGVRS